MELQRGQIDRFNRNRSEKGHRNHGSGLWSTYNIMQDAFIDDPLELLGSRQSLIRIASGYVRDPNNGVFADK